MVSFSSRCNVEEILQKYFKHHHIIVKRKSYFTHPKFGSRQRGCSSLDTRRLLVIFHFFNFPPLQKIHSSELILDQRFKYLTFYFLYNSIELEQRSRTRVN